MVDDSMEISSDRGHEAGDEDIDIDIDLTAGQIDEDYVLEDAASNIDIVDSTPLQPSPLAGADDVMIDEDDGSYPMDDADLTHDGQEQNMDQETTSMLFVPVDAPPLNDNEYTDTLGIIGDGRSGQSDLIWEQREVPEPGLDETGVQLEDSENTIHHEEVGDLNDQSNNEAVEPVKSGYDHGSRTASPQASPEDLAVEEPRSPPASNPERHSASRDGSLNHSDPSQSPHEAFNTDSDAEITTIPQNGDALPAVHDIVVLYQSVEYALFGESESNDPDSFFLSDLSIADKPISDFFKAMREIIHEDLTNEEELCISVDDLGLEIEETVSSLHDVSLTQILSLHERLLQNDGVEPPRPLYIALGTRPSFARRLANLMAGAAEGKGLSQLVTWEEQSEEFNDSGEAGEYLQNRDTPGESELASEGFRDDVEATATKLLDEGEVGNSTQSTTSQELEPLQDSGRIQEQKDDLSAPEKVQDRILQQDAPSDAKGSPRNETQSNGEYDEDGDLIDYSDEEDQNSIEQKHSHPQAGPDLVDDNRTNNGTADFISPCLKPNTCFCSKCSDLLLAEYEAINEELRRRSISLAAEESLLEQAKEKASTLSNESDKQQNVPRSQVSVEYEVDNEEVWEPDDEKSHEYLTGENTDATAGMENHDYEDLIDDEVGGDGELIDNGPSTGSRNHSVHEGDDYADENDDAPFGNENEFEDHYEDGQHHILPQPQADRAQQNGISLMGNGNNETRQDTSGEPGIADPAHSSATVSADESQHEDLHSSYGDFKTSDPLISTQHVAIAVNADHEDEIDYEEDEEEQGLKEPQDLREAPKQSPAASGGAGKRARTDSDDAMTTRSKDAKRPRS